MKYIVARCPDCNMPITYNDVEDTYKWRCKCYVGRGDEAEELLSQEHKELAVDAVEVASQ